MLTVNLIILSKWCKEFQWAELQHNAAVIYRPDLCGIWIEHSHK